MVLYIKNMVCVRCKMAVASILEAQRIDYNVVKLGQVELPAAISSRQQKLFNDTLKRYELELMEDKKDILVERIKVFIISQINEQHKSRRLKLSVYLSQELELDYTYLSNVFSEREGSTIERFYIVTRIEKVKELMVYEALSITEIACRLEFSNVSHLCLQFKKITGHTPSAFKKLLLTDDFVWRQS